MDNSATTTTKFVKKLTWDKNVYSPKIKRICECFGCTGCNKNGTCHNFGFHICNICNSRRCGVCFYNDGCKYCNKQ